MEEESLEIRKNNQNLSLPKIKSYKNSHLINISSVSQKNIIIKN